MKIKMQIIPGGGKIHPILKFFKIIKFGNKEVETYPPICFHDDYGGTMSSWIENDIFNEKTTIDISQKQIIDIYLICKSLVKNSFKEKSSW